MVHWVDTQRKEREAYYKTETLRRITEASGEGAKAAVELMRADERLKRIKAREGMKIGGLVNIGVGIGLLIFLHALMPGNGDLPLRDDSRTHRRGIPGLRLSSSPRQWSRNPAVWRGRNCAPIALAHAGPATIPAV